MESLKNKDYEKKEKTEMDLMIERLEEYVKTDMDRLVEELEEYKLEYSKRLEMEQKKDKHLKETLNDKENAD